MDAGLEQGTVKWYDPIKGYGFIARDGGGEDIFVHRSAVGYEGLDEGDRVEFAAGVGQKGPAAEQVRVVEKNPSPPPRRGEGGGSGERGGFGDGGSSYAADPAAVADLPLVRGTVKRYDVEKGYGFIARDEGGDDVFVHRSAALPDSLGSGDVVEFRLGAGQKGPRAEQVRIIERGSSGASGGGWDAGYGSGGGYDQNDRGGW